MILRRFGRTIEAVQPKFKATALTEIGFQRSGEAKYTTDEFAETFERVDERLVAAESEGNVKGEVEEELLQALLNEVREIEAGLDDGAVLVFENLPGQDFPKTVDVTRNVMEKGENRLHFTYRVDPPLRFGVYRRRG